MKSARRLNNWQAAFVAMLPELERRLRRAFRPLDAASREEAVAEAVALCAVAFVRLHERGRTHVASASTLAYYSSRQVNRGRTAAGQLNGTEPLSRYAQVRHGIRVENDQWVDQLIDNTRWSVADQVAVRIDARQWLASLSRRVRHIARDLAQGCSTSEVAEKHGLTSGRISQMRRELCHAWRAFQGEVAPTAV